MFAENREILRVWKVPFEPDYFEVRPWSDVYMVAEEMPEFPNGDPAAYIQKHMRYPE